MKRVETGDMHPATSDVASGHCDDCDVGHHGGWRHASGRGMSDGDEAGAQPRAGTAFQR
jgi:hypothetical protein